MNCLFSYQRKFLLLFYSEAEEKILHNHCQRYFSAHLNYHHHRDLTFTLAELLDL